MASMRLLRKAKILVKRKVRARRVNSNAAEQRMPRLPRYVLENIHHPVLRLAWAADLQSGVRWGTGGFGHLAD